MITQVLNLPYKQHSQIRYFWGPPLHCHYHCLWSLCNYICPTCKIHSPSSAFPRSLGSLQNQLKSRPCLDIVSSSVPDLVIGSISVRQVRLLSMIHHDTNFFSICEPSNQMMSYLLPKNLWRQVRQWITTLGRFHSKREETEEGRKE